MSDIWKSVIDADLKDAEYIKRPELPDGTYAARVANIEAKVFQTGSKGLEVTYVIADGEHKQRDIRDYIILVTAQGAPNKQGPATVKKLMMECGLTTDKINKFRFPVFGEKGFGDFKFLLDQPLTLSVKQKVQKTGNNKGELRARVESFKQRAEDEQAA